MKQYKIVVICMCILLLLAGGVYAQQKTVRILAIGNSFSQDAVEQYLHELAEAEGISTIIGNMFIGGCSLERHVKNARDNAPAYAFRSGFIPNRCNCITVVLEAIKKQPCENRSTAL